MNTVVTTAQEYARGVAAMLHAARERGGGRVGCCSRGLCAMHLAEQSAETRRGSTVHLGNSLALFPDTQDQELVVGAAREACRRGRQMLGFPEGDAS